MSHLEKKKSKQIKRNDYDLREVYSFETVSAIVMQLYISHQT